MAGLIRPEKCASCESKELHREWYPERWVCENKHIVVSRKQKPQTGVCRDCGKSATEVPFENHGNICTACRKIYNDNYRKENTDEIAKQHRDSYQVNKTKRQEAVKKAVQRSPEAFIRHLLHHVTKNCNYRRVKMHKLNPVSLNVDIDYEHLIGLWKQQDGKCAITKLSMDHCWNSMRSISVDRINSGKGYLKGNVQLVCQVINRAKNNHSNEDMHIFLNAYFDERVRRRLAGIEHIQDLCRKEALVVLAAADKEIVASLAKAAYDRSPGFESD